MRRPVLEQTDSTMVHPHIINSINGLVLIVAGLVSYVVSPAQPAIALVIPAFGLLLLACTYHLRRHNRFVFHTVTSLTLLAGILLLLQLRTYTWAVPDILLLVMGISCFVASAFYVGTFVRERRLRDNSVYKDDL